MVILTMNSLHQVGLLDTLKLGELVDRKLQETVVIGSQPEATGMGIGLNATVTAQLERATKLVLQEINLTIGRQSVRAAHAKGIPDAASLFL